MNNVGVGQRVFKLEGHEGTVRALTLHEEDELLYRCVLFVCSDGNYVIFNHVNE